MRRAARFGQGWFTFNRLPDELPAALEQLDRHLAAAGRKRTRNAGFELTVSPYFNTVTPELVKAYAAAGVDRLVVVCLAFTTDDLLPALDRLVEEVLEPARR